MRNTERERGKGPGEEVRRKRPKGREGKGPRGKERWEREAFISWEMAV